MLDARAGMALRTRCETAHNSRRRRPIRLRTTGTARSGRLERPDQGDRHRPTRARLGQPDQGATGTARPGATRTARSGREWNRRHDGDELAVAVRVPTFGSLPGQVVALHLGCVLEVTRLVAL